MTASAQVGQTGLMRGLRKLAIRRPAVPDEHAGKVGPEQGRRLVESAAAMNRVHRLARRGRHPQPVQFAPHAPAGFVGYDNAALPHHLAQRVVRGRGLTSGAMQGVDETARRHREPKMLSIEPHDLAEWQATLLVQMRGGGDRHGAELRRRGSERVGGLQEMPALHGAATLLTLANVHMERADDRADRRQVFLVLRGRARELEGAATVRTRQGQLRRCRSHRPRVASVVGHGTHMPRQPAAPGGRHDLADGPSQTARLGESPPGGPHPVVV